MKEETKIYLDKDVDAEIIVEETTRKYLLNCIDEYIENLKNNPEYVADDEMFAILYEDGTEEVIDLYFYEDNPLNYHIKRQHIKSITYDNPETVMTYGPYEINDCGVVTTSDEMKIDDNIQYLRSEF